MSSVLMLGDCRDRLKELPDNSIDSIVTDPPYELGFMGKSWDASGVAYDVTVWQECLRVLKPGGHLLSFGGSRTYHRMACAIEDAGFQIRDQIMWVYGSGFPKSLNISKAIDKAAGFVGEVIGKGSSWNRPDSAEGDRARMNTSPGEYDIKELSAEAKEWDGWGTALKPAHEPIVLARKPLDGTVANNVLTHGVGGINIDGSRVNYNGEKPSGWFDEKERTNAGFKLTAGSSSAITSVPSTGRFPANFIHDGSDEVLQLFPNTSPSKAAARGGTNPNPMDWGNNRSDGDIVKGHDDNGGSAARFFYCAKASKKDRNEGLDGFPLVKGGSMNGAETRPDRPTNHPIRANHHPTVKPTDLMRYLCRLVTPPNGTVLDPFTGSGSTGKAAVLEGFNFIGVEQSAEYIEIAKARIGAAE